jgi:hypothetical protein
LLHWLALVHAPLVFLGVHVPDAQ